jgi:hypothetical protein
MGQADVFFEQRAKTLIKEAMEAQALSFKELSRRLEGIGVVCNDRQLTNRINRGKFSFAFALAVFRALGLDAVPVPDPRKGRRGR